MDSHHPLFNFTKYNENIFEIYKERNLFHLSEKDIEGKSTASFFANTLRKKRQLHKLSYSYFKIHDELDFISKDLKYVVGVLYFLRPFIVDTKYTDGVYHQNLPDHRYLMYANFGYQSIYNFWDRIGDLIHIYFETGLPIDKVYFGRVLTNIKDPYNVNQNVLLDNPHLKKLRELYDSELKPFFDERNEAVHHFQLEAKHYWGNIEKMEGKTYLELNAEKQRYPDFLNKHLELFFAGFELAIKLIDSLPDKLLVFLKKKEMTDDQFKIESARLLSKEDITSYFEVDKFYRETMVVEKISTLKSVNSKLVVLAGEPQPAGKAAKT